MKRSETKGVSLWHNSLKLITAGAFVQAVAFLLLPLIGRLYTREEIGLLSLFLGLSGVISIAGNARYDQAVLIAPKQTHSQILSAIAVRVNIWISILLIPLIYFLLPLVSETNYRNLGAYIWLLPPVVFLSGIYNLLVSYHNAEKRFESMGKSQVVQGILNNGGKVGFGFAGGGVLGLQVSYILGLVGGIVSLWRHVPVKTIRKISTRRRRLILAKHYGNFPRNGIIQSMVDNLSGSILVLMLPMKFTDEIVGVVAMALMLTARPLGIVSEAVSRVFCRKIIEMKEQHLSNVQYIHRFLKRYVWVVIPFVMLVIFGTKPAINIFLGEKWLPTATVIIAMVSYLPTWFLSSVFNVIPDLLFKQRAFMYLQIVLLLLQAGTILIGMKFLSFEGFLWLYFGVRTLDCLTQFTWFYLLLKKDERKSLAKIR